MRLASLCPSYIVQPCAGGDIIPCEHGIIQLDNYPNCEGAKFSGKLRVTLADHPGNADIADGLRQVGELSKVDGNLVLVFERDHFDFVAEVVGAHKTPSWRIDKFKQAAQSHRRERAKL